MAKLKAKQTLRGKYGKVAAGEDFELSKKDGQKLVDKGLAEFVDESEEDETEEENESSIKVNDPKTEKKTVTIRKEKNDQAGPAGETKKSDPTVG